MCKALSLCARQCVPCSPCLAGLLSLHVLQHDLDLLAALTSLTLLVHAVLQGLEGGERRGDRGRGEGVEGGAHMGRARRGAAQCSF